MKLCFSTWQVFYHRVICSVFLWLSHSYLLTYSSCFVCSPPVQVSAVCMIGQIPPSSLQMNRCVCVCVSPLLSNWLDRVELNKTSFDHKTTCARLSVLDRSIGFTEPFFQSIQFYSVIRKSFWVCGWNGGGRILLPDIFHRSSFFYFSKIIRSIFSIAWLMPHLGLQKELLGEVRRGKSLFFSFLNPPISLAFLWGSSVLSRHKTPQMDS